MSTHAVLAQMGGMGNPLVVLLFPILLAVLVGGPLAALAGIVLATWRWRSPVWGGRIPRWLGLYALAVNVAFIAYLLATKKDFAAPPFFEWPARVAMVLGFLALVLGVRPLLFSAEARRRGTAWLAVTAALVAAALAVERESGRRQVRQDVIEAARRGNVAAVQEAIDGGLDAVTRVQMLHAATTDWQGPQVPVVDLLLRAGTDPNAPAAKGESTWHDFVRYGDVGRERVETARLFLAHGADANASWEDGTAVSLAWAKGDAQLLDELRAAGARDPDVDEAQFRSLVEAVRAGDMATVDSLRDAGVPWKHRGSGGMDVLTAAAEGGRIDILRRFTTGGGYHLDDTDAALLAAAQRGRLDSVAFLLTTYVSPQGVDAAAAAAKEAGQEEIVQYIRSHWRPE